MKSKEIRQALTIISDSLWLAENIEDLPNCNNCRHKDDCPYCPKAGEMSRINCFAWEK